MENVFDRGEAKLFHENPRTEDVVNYFDEWADKYDEDLSNTYIGPSEMATAICSLFDQSKRGSLEVLDIGAGSGLVSQKLKPLGFMNIDALEPSSNMLQKAKDKGLYRNYYNTIIDEEVLTERNGFYDCVVSSGCVNPTCIRPKAFKDFARLTKPGGYVVIVMRMTFGQEFDDTLRSEIRQLEDQGKWRMESEQRIDNYFFKERGATFVFKVLR